MISQLSASYKVPIYTICFNGCSCLCSVLFMFSIAGQKQNQRNHWHAKICFLILKIFNYFLHLRIHLRLLVISKASNKMVFEMVLQMVFVPKLCTVKTYIYMVKTKLNRNLQKYGMNWYNIIWIWTYYQKIFLLNMF